MANRPFEEDVESNAEIVRPRPEWLKLYYLRFADSTKVFDSEQVGWYWRLLLFAASQGEPPGYLNNDDEELRKIAEVKDKPAEEVMLLSQTEQGLQYLNAWRERQERRWQKVLSKFPVSRADSSLLYNKMLVATLTDAYRKQKQTVKAGKLSWQNRESKEEPQTESKHSSRGHLTANALAEEDILPLITPTQTVESKLPEPNGLRANAIANVPTDARTKREQMLTTRERAVFSVVNTDISIDNQQTQNSVNDESVFKLVDYPNIADKKISSIDKPSLLKRKPESLFDESKFVLTEEMSVHLRAKYPNFVLGDWEFLTEEFKNIFYGKRKASWKRTFYTFVNNQVMRYGYEQGDYLKRETTQSRSSQTSSASARTVQAERKLNELSARYLQSSSVGNTEDVEEALPLASDDIRDSS